MNKWLLDGWVSVDPDHADPTEGAVAWQKFVRRGQLQDLKPHWRVRRVGDLMYQPLGPAGEIKSGKIGEQSYQIQGITKAIMFALSRVAIINDDLSAFSGVPTDFGVGHGRTVATTSTAPC